MNNSQTNPASEHAITIGEALDRLRGRRRGSRGTPGPNGRPHEHRRSESGVEPAGLAGEGGSHADKPARRGAGGFPAIIRMLEALAKADEPQGVGDIGEAIGVDQPRASRLVQQGVSRGLVAREADPLDARRTRIALTDEGREFANGIRLRQQEALGVALQGFSDSERADLARLLTRLADGWPMA